MKALNDEFKNKLTEITELTYKINKGNKLKIIEMMKEHVEEIQDLYNKNNDHWAIETADLIVLCYELLLLEELDIDDVFDRCIPRFDVKLKRLAENVN